MRPRSFSSPEGQLQQGGSPVSTVLIVIVMAAFIVFRNMRPQKLNMSRLWILPGILVLLSAFVIFGATYAQYANGVDTPPVWELIAAVAIGIVLGIPLGLARGHASKVRLSEEKGILIVEPSIAVMLIWLAAFALKYGLRAILPNAGPGLIVVSDGFLAFAVASVVTVRYVLFRKFKELHLTEAKVVES
ncbi:MAG: CcdC protein domain-containing protein [Candidatus Baltobacteraceae bacterium]